MTLKNPSVSLRTPFLAPLFSRFFTCDNGLGALAPRPHARVLQKPRFLPSGLWSQNQKNASHVITFSENHCLEKSPLVNLRAKWHQICVFVRPYGVLCARQHHFSIFAARERPLFGQIRRGLNYGQFADFAFFDFFDFRTAFFARTVIRL